MLTIKEIRCTIIPSKNLKGYYALDVYARTSHGEKELHELIQGSDFKSKFDDMTEILKNELITLMSEENYD